MPGAGSGRSGRHRARNVAQTAAAQLYRAYACCQRCRYLVVAACLVLIVAVAVLWSEVVPPLPSSQPWAPAPGAVHRSHGAAAGVDVQQVLAQVEGAAQRARAREEGQGRPPGAADGASQAGRTSPVPSTPGIRGGTAPASGTSGKGTAAGPAANSKDTDAAVRSSYEARLEAELQRLTGHERLKTLLESIDARGYRGIQDLETINPDGIPMVNPACGPVPDHQKPLCTYKNAGRDISRAPGRWCRANAVWLLRQPQAAFRERSVWFWTVDSCRLRWFTVEEARVRCQHSHAVVSGGGGG